MKTEPAKTTEKTIPTLFTYKTWCDEECPDHAVYRNVVFQPGKPKLLNYFDSLDRIILTKKSGFDGNEVVSSSKFDALGNIKVEVEPHYNGDTGARVSYFDYDAHGRPGSKLVERSPINFSVQFKYLGNSTLFDIESESVNLSFARDHDLAGKPTSITDALGNISYFQYDGFGNPIYIRDVKGAEVRSKYSGMGNRHWLDDPNIGFWRFKYNGLGELVWQKDANGVVTTQSYDRLGRTINISDGHWIVDRTFDAPGHLGKLINEASNNGYFKQNRYDSLQRIVETVVVQI